MVTRQPFGLARRDGFLAPDLAHGEIDVLVIGRVGKPQEAVHLSDCIEPPLYGGRSLGLPLVFEKMADGFDAGGERLFYPVLYAPVPESLDIGLITSHYCWRIGALEAPKFGAPITVDISKFHATLMIEINHNARPGIDRAADKGCSRSSWMVGARFGR